MVIKIHQQIQMQVNKKKINLLIYIDVQIIQSALSIFPFSFFFFFVISERVMALYPHQAQNDDELSFDKGDVITVLAKQEEAWWKGELNGVCGIFPSNYVTPMCE